MCRRRSIVLALCMGLLMVFIVGCDRPNAPWCLMRAGDWATDTLRWDANAAPIMLTIETHLEVECAIGTDDEVEVIWSGPSNLLAHASADWSGNELVLGHEDRCQWTRDLSHVVQVKVTAPRIHDIHLHGQGTFQMSKLDSAQHLNVEARDYAGAIELDLRLDSATVKLHNGAAQATVSGEVTTLEAYSSGLSRLRTAGCSARYGFIHQAGASNLSFRATDYAYVVIDAPGNVLGGETPPLDWELKQLGSGVLLWSD